MIFEIFCILKCLYYFFMYKTYTYFNINKIVLLEKMYSFIIDLGPFFVKILQNIGSKQLLPPDLLEISEKSKDSVYYNTNDYSQILKNIKDTGFELESNVPIGAGSICLVYKGIYKGHNSIIKICHNNIKQKMKKGIQIIEFITNTCKFFGVYTIFINNIDFQDTIKSVNQQINLNQEVENIKRYKKQLEMHDLLNLIDVPTVYIHNNNYIIESYIDGLSYNDIVQTHKNKTFECITLVQVLSRYQAMCFDIQHGDLHTSNYLYTIENNKVKLHLIDFGLCLLSNKYTTYGRKISYKYYLPEIFTTHPIATLFTYIKAYPETISYINNENFKETFKFLRKLKPNIDDNLLIKHIYDNIDQITRKDMFDVQFENYEHLNVFFHELKNEGIKLSYLFQTTDKMNLNVLISQNGFFQTNELTSILTKEDKYCDIKLSSHDLYENFLEYYIKYVIENLPQEKYLDDIDDKIKMSYQQIIYMFQIKYKKQLDRKYIKNILLTHQHEIKDYLYHFFYRNEYYIQRNIIINKMYALFFIESDLLHGMIEYLQLKNPNGLKQEYYDIPVLDINIDNIVYSNKEIVYVHSEKGIFKDDVIIKIDEKNISNCNLQECLNMIQTGTIITFRDCFSLI
jgi:tRNA A-37 threonylcarbamoyl transferase component Bud32